MIRERQRVAPRGLLLDPAELLNAGLDDLPDTLMARSIVVRMRRRAPGEHVQPWRLRINGPEAEGLHKRLEDWAHQRSGAVGWPDTGDRFRGLRNEGVHGLDR